MVRGEGRTRAPPPRLLRRQFPQTGQETLRPIPLLLGPLLGCARPGLRNLGHGRSPAPAARCPALRAMQAARRRSRGDDVLWTEEGPIDHKGA